jgi:hypothetical protein
MGVSPMACVTVEGEVDPTRGYRIDYGRIPASPIQAAPL